MTTQNLSMQSVVNQNTFFEEVQPLNGQNVTLPLLLPLSSLISFKISKSRQTPAFALVEIVSSNKSPLSIKSAYKMIFKRQFEKICRNKLARACLKKNFKKYILQPQHQPSFQPCQSLNSLLQFQVFIQNYQLEIEFSQLKSTLEFIQISQTDLIEILILSLKVIVDPLTVLFQKMGTIKPKFCQRLKNNMTIEKQIKIIKKIIHQKKVLTMPMSLQLETEINNQKNGVFEYVDVIEQIPTLDSQFSFKKGGYFNIGKRKLLIRNQSSKQSQIQHKIFAQKKLNRRKRPNTIYNYESKIPKQLNFLGYLNKLPETELDRFAKYYILNESTRIDIRNQSMVDQADSVSKGTFSTHSQEQPLNTMTDVIYMDYYDENLEQYLENKGRLDVCETVVLLRQILESVLVLQKVGIVHRDIKPANFMVDRTKDGVVKLKLIDFGQSTHVSAAYSQSQILGFSTPYAPIQCTYPCKQGFNLKQIDLWSLGVVVYQLTTGRMPVTYSKCFKSDIKLGWPTDLSFFITKFGRGKWSIVQNILVMMALLFMKVKPENRLSIDLGLKILDQVQKIVNQLSQQQAQ